MKHPSAPSLAPALPPLETPTNLVVAHGGGPTAVINASLAGVVREGQGHPRIGRILAARRGIEGVLAGDYMDLTGLTAQELERLAVTPASAIGTCRHKVSGEEYRGIARSLRSVGAEIFLYNGGNDSMDTCMEVSRAAPSLRALGIPKTIDNDLAGTDHSPGYGSAARFYALAALEVALDVAALNIHVCVLETMGRNAGWLAAATVLSREIGGTGPELVLLPERPFDQKRFLEEVRRLWETRRGFVVAVSEGLADADGALIAADTGRAGVDAFGHALPGNVSQVLAQLITQELGIRARSEKPGLLGRAAGYYVSEVDRAEAEAVGAHAVQWAAAGYSGVMVSLTRPAEGPYRADLDLVRLHDVANVESRLPNSMIDESELGVTAAFLDYARPLIGGDLPHYLRLG